MKILLVEDHPDSRRNLRRLIEGRGHDVVAVTSAEEAEAVLTTQKFPFLILDWMLPGKSGVDLCRELRARPGGDEMFIVLVTARADTEDLQQALEAGANDYLSKPLDLGLLNVRLSVAERQIRDLSERNETRAELQESARKVTNILENTTDGFYAVDHDWRFTYLNSEAEAMLELPRDELLGTVIWEKLPHLSGSLFETSFRTVMAEQIAVAFEATDNNGKTWFEVHSYPSGDGVSVFFRDITERKRAEGERLTMSKLESLGTLAGGIAHDLNNILTVISGNIGLAQIEAPSDCGNLLSFLAKAGQAAQHAAHLSSQLLTFSKGGAPLKKVTSVSELLEQAAEFTLYGSNLRADVQIAPNLWKAEVDASQIEQVVNALMLNARDAMPDGGTVRIAASNVELHDRSALLLPGRYIKVTVADGGEGIQEGVVTKIFDPYFTTKPAATGLGLAISYSIVKKHGGLLHLESSSPKGATFVFYLRATDRKATAEPRKAPEPLYHFNHQRVLVMDDEAAIRDLTSQLLRTLGYEVTAVPDGLEAVRTYERALRQGQQFQVVILDATVRGGMGGVATIERLRGMDPEVNAIICSGYSDEAAMAEFLAWGFRGALPKPFTRRELAEALQRTFETAKLN